MITKAETTRHNIKSIHGSERFSNSKTTLIDSLKQLLPQVINSDHQVNVNALHGLIDPHNTTANNKGYELTFAGKGIARAMADSPTTKELRTEHRQSKHFDSTGNVVIRGDNLDVLKILYQNYHNKIKMIYIDPPYNTGNDDFIYNNDFRKNEETLIEEYGLNEETTDFLHNVYGTKSHSGWLAFMYPRLKLARDLLKDDGVIVIAIDHYELNNLICIADEIYGEENRIGLISVVHKPEGRNQAKFFAPSNEFMLFYSKNINECSFRNTVIDNTVAETFDMEDNAGKYRLNNYLRTGGGDPSLRINKPQFFYPIYVSSDLRTISLEKIEGYKVLPITKAGQERTWKTKKEAFYQSYLKGNIIAKKNSRNEIEIYEKYREKQILKTYWHQSKYHAIHHGTNVVSKLLGGNYFDFPKSVYLVQDVLKICTNSNDLILDFFAGSGTTGDAVMQLNAEDNGNRKFILVQWDEVINKKKNKEAHDFCEANKLPSVISSICIERINRAGQKLQQQHEEKDSLKLEDFQTDIGYKVFSLTDKPCINQEGSMFKIDNERSSILNTLYNMIAATCKPLDATISTIIPECLYKCGDDLYLIAPVDPKTLQQYNDTKINIDAYADIGLEDYLNLGVARGENVTVVF